MAFNRMQRVLFTFESQVGRTLPETLEKKPEQIFGSLTRRGVKDAIRMLLSANSAMLMPRPPETQVSLEFALKCGYLDQKLFGELDVAYDHIMGKLVNTITCPKQWKIRSQSD